MPSFMRAVTYNTAIPQAQSSTLVWGSHATPGDARKHVDQMIRLDRLPDVHLEPPPQGLHPVLIAPVSGQCHGHQASALFRLPGANLPNERVVAVLLGHADVGHEDVRHPA